jgi:hypothetical protein
MSGTSSSKPSKVPPDARISRTSSLILSHISDVSLVSGNGDRDSGVRFDGVGDEGVSSVRARVRVRGAREGWNRERRVAQLAGIRFDLGADV